MRQRSQSVCRQLALLEQERSWLVDREAALVAREQLADSVLGGGDDKLELRFQHLVQLLVPGCALRGFQLRAAAAAVLGRDVFVIEGAGSLGQERRSSRRSPAWSWAA